MQVHFQPVSGDREIAIVADLANTIWNEYYVPLIGREQVDYMLGKFQTGAAIKSQIEKDGYHYYLIYFEEMPIGYMGVQIRDEELFLSKLYILKEYRGMGRGRAGIDFLVELCYKKGLHSITLTVNKGNSNTIAAYLAIGFTIYAADVFEIGDGFQMDDYKMKLSVDSYGSKS